MKLSKAEWSEVYNLKELTDEQYANLVKPGTKFHNSGDRDPWYIVGTVPDGNTILVVSKSWAKHKQRWVYKVEDIFIMLDIHCMLGELYKDEAGNFHIKFDKNAYKK